MTKKRMRGFTADGFVRVQRTVLRRVVGDRLQALLRGDFYVRNRLGEDDYEPIIREVEALHVPAAAGRDSSSLAHPPSSSSARGNSNGRGGEEGGDAGGHASSQPGANGAVPPRRGPPPQSPPTPDPQTFTPKLETFIQLIAASIMIDASMRGENAGESDTRFIKKKKKLLAKTLQGPKLGDFRGEVLRFDRIQRGEEFSEEEIVESEESKTSSSEEESDSDKEDLGAAAAASKKKKLEKHSSQPQQQQEQQQPLASSSSNAHPPPSHQPQSASEGGESSSEEDEGADSTVSDSAVSSSLNSRSNSTLDGFSTSAASSKHQKKKDKKKRLKKERKRIRKEERRRLKKERKRREKEERKRKKRKMEKDKKLDRSKAKKKRKVEHHRDNNGENASNSADDESSDGNAAVDDSMDHSHSSGHDDGGQDESAHTSTANYDGDEPQIYEVASKEDFDRYKAALLSRVPNDVKSRFREGGFSRWGKDWLPVLELGPFDVEPGPVRDMWLEMFDNTQENGRDMTRLVFWYGVKFEDRGQAYSFVPGNKITPYEKGQGLGYCKIPKKIQKKVEKKQRLTKTEEQIKRGLKEIEADMLRDTNERAAWMMQFKEDYELAEQEAAKEEADQKLRSDSVGEMEVDDDGKQVEEEEEIVAPVPPKKRKRGRPKKEETIAAEAAGVQTKRKPGRPKKVVDAPPPEEDEGGAIKVKKKGPGRPRKSDKEKAERAAEKTKAKAAASAIAVAEKKQGKESTAKKWLVVDDEDQESEIETDKDEGDRDYEDDADSDDGIDVAMDNDDDDDSDAVETSKSSDEKHKTSKSKKKSKKKSKSSMSHMTEEEKAIERRSKAAEYREKKARERAEAQGIEYVKGRVGRKSTATVLSEEQMKFSKCEEVFCPLMDQLTEAKDDTANVKGVLKCINLIMERVELLTPPFLREYPLGMLVKTVRKSFESTHPEVKDQCKRLTTEMKRVYTEKEKKIPDGFEPVKNTSSNQQGEALGLLAEAPASAVTESAKSEKAAVVTENVAPTIEDAVVVKSEKVAPKPVNVQILIEPSIPKRNSEMSLSEPMTRKIPKITSSECLPDSAVKTDQQQSQQPKQKKTFSIKGMFDKPKPPSRPKIVAPAPSRIVSGQPSPKPKSLPSWVTGPAMKMEVFHEQHTKERTFGLEFLVDAASLATSTRSKRFDPISVSQSFELAIFAETKLRGRNWQQYWEKVHDVVAMLSPGRNKRNAILQGIINGNYQEPSELVKLSRREIQSLNRLKT